MTAVNRRTFLKGAGAAGVAVVATAGTASAAGPDLTPPPGFDFPVGGPLPFAHGVASGDPLADRVILWTRVTVPDPARFATVEVTWQVGTDPQLTGPPVATGSVSTDASRDYTVKVDATGLRAGTTYYYRFAALGRTSLTGRTRTAVDDVVHELRFGVVSCASYWSVVRWDGMRRLSERNDLDLVVHCGDHVYDYPDEDEWVRARGKTDPATFDPADVDFRSWRSLAEVRRRYALYCADPDFIALHQQHPLFVLWDNHDLSQGENDMVPEAQVIQAFWEWTPSRPPKGDGSGAFGPAQTGQVTPANQDYVYRSLPYGPLGDLRCIDVRHIATDSERKAGRLLGSTQLTWLQRSMQASHDAGTAWRLVVNGFPFGQLKLVDPSPAAAALLPQQAAGGVAFYGAWDSFPAERSRVVQHLRSNGITDNLLLTGDAHGSFVWDVTDDDSAPGYVKATGKTATGGVSSVGVEILPTSLGRGGATETIAGMGYRETHNGSPPYGDRAGFQPYLDAAPPGSAALSQALTQANQSLQYLEWDSHGYGIVHLTEARAVLELWWQPIRTASDSETLGAQFVVPRGADHPTQVLQPAATSGSRTSPPAPTGPSDQPAPTVPEVPTPALLVAAGLAAGVGWLLRRRLSRGGT